MRIHFYLRYHTNFGESLFVSINQQALQPLQYLNNELWEGVFDIQPSEVQELQWQYSHQAKDGSVTAEWESERRLCLLDCNQDYLQIFDSWNPTGAVENAFFTKPFQLQLAEAKPVETGNGDFLFRVKAPLLKPNEVVCLLGHGKALRDWDTLAPLLLHLEGNWWSVQLNLHGEKFPVGYKYGVWDKQKQVFLGFESGGNRTLIHNSAEGNQLSGLTHDGFLRMPNNTWRAAGVSIPVFSLRSEKSWGIGEFSDIPLLANWAQSLGMKMIQLLPINDTTSTHSWTDSYPYAPVSVFALHPIYLNLDLLAAEKHAAVLKPYLKKRKQLNALDQIDYEAVLQLKWEIIRQLYDLQKAEWLKDSDWNAYYQANKHWLDPYVVFCWLRDSNGSPDFTRWGKHAQYRESEVQKLLSPKSAHFDQIALHLFVQWHLHLQLKAAVAHSHRLGISLKGDLPIGIYRDSADAWIAPDLYNMNMQAGAPPDSFAEKGQNWGFPTYNWERMKADGFAWWRQRFEQMSHYFDAFRIDHILGFFRIWSIPLHAVEGILGSFSPAIPVTEQELIENGIGFNFQRLCKPFITEPVLYELFQEQAVWVLKNCLRKTKDGNWELLPKFDTQRKVEIYFASQQPTDANARLKQGLFDLIANVILLDIPNKDIQKGWQGAFRFDMEKTSSFRFLPNEIKAPLKALYVNYFYQRQDDFWKKEAIEKLPALKRSTNMLICGEDLGLVPACVPGVMRDLGLLSLEIQRMPKEPGAAFLHPEDAPYLSVITPGTHDMSVLRGWWEENRELSQRFFHEILNEQGDAPYFCEPWVVQKIIVQHLHAPAMWAIFQLQDLLGMDAGIRRQNPQEERINIPANPKHYWRYRMHISLESLIKSEPFNKNIKDMIRESGRGL